MAQGIAVHDRGWQMAEACSRTVPVFRSADGAGDRSSRQRVANGRGVLHDRPWVLISRWHRGLPFTTRGGEWQRRSPGPSLGFDHPMAPGVAVHDRGWHMAQAFSRTVPGNRPGRAAAGPLRGRNPLPSLCFATSGSLVTAVSECSGAPGSRGSPSPTFAIFARSLPLRSPQAAPCGGDTLRSFARKSRVSPRLVGPSASLRIPGRSCTQRSIRRRRGSRGDGSPARTPGGIREVGMGPRRDGGARPPLRGCGAVPRPLRREEPSPVASPEIRAGGIGG